MKYHVRIAEVASEQIEDAYAWLAERTIHATAWHDGLVNAIDSLEKFPTRCPLVPEKEDASGNVRQLLFGTKRHSYRIIFEIQGDAVTILQVRHAARRRGG